LAGAAIDRSAHKCWRDYSLVFTTADPAGWRRRTILDGVRNIDAMRASPEFAENCGDMLFLVRNLLNVASADAEPQLHAATSALVGNIGVSVLALLEHYVSAEDGDFEIDQILTLVEGVHVLEKLGVDRVRGMADGAAPRGSASSSGGAAAAAGVAGRACTASGGGGDADGADAAGSGADGSPAGGGGGGGDESGPARPQARRRSRARACVASGAAKKAENASLLTRVKARVAKDVCNNHVADILGFDPSVPILPLTKATYCGNCGNDARPGNKGAALPRCSPGGTSECGKCGFALRQCFDYGAMTDALIWTYVSRWRCCCCCCCCCC